MRRIKVFNCWTLLIAVVVMFCPLGIYCAGKMPGTQLPVLACLDMAYEILIAGPMSTLFRANNIRREVEQSCSEIAAQPAGSEARADTILKLLPWDYSDRIYPNFFSVEQLKHYYGEALAIKEAHHGKDSATLIDPLERLSNIYCNDPATNAKPEAIALCRREMALYLKNPDVYTWGYYGINKLLYCYHRAGDKHGEESVVAQIEDHCRRNKGSGLSIGLYQQIVNLAYEEGDNAKEEKYLQKLIALLNQDKAKNQASIDCWTMRLGYVYSRTGRMPEAVTALEHSITQKQEVFWIPGDKEVRSILLRAYICTGEYDKARQLAAVLIRVDGKKPRSPFGDCLSHGEETSFVAQDYLDLYVADVLQHKTKEAAADLRLAKDAANNNFGRSVPFKSILKYYVPRLEADKMNDVAKRLLKEA